MKIIIDVPDAQAQRVLNGFCADRGYQPTLPDDTPNPETKAQFVKRLLIQYIKNSVRMNEIQAASEAAIVLATAKVDAEINLS